MRHNNGNNLAVEKSNLDEFPIYTVDLRLTEHQVFIGAKITLPIHYFAMTHHKLLSNYFYSTVL